VAREQISARQFATQQAEKAAKDAQKAQEEAAREAARVITEQNRAAQEQIRQQTQAAQEAVRRAYVETADEAVAQYQRIANATPAPVDTLQQQIDEATNRQVRAGTQGTADAEKQLDDIRKAHLAILPDLVALDKQYADATAAKQAADAAHDHAAELSAERSQAISDTNALKGVADQRKAMADDAASRQIGGMPGGGAWQPGMGGGGGDNTAHIDPSYWTRNLSALDPRNILQPTIVTHVNFNAPVTTTQGDFQQSVVNAVQQADRQNGLNLTRYAPR
jgi:hypothetical protein